MITKIFNHSDNTASVSFMWRVRPEVIERGAARLVSGVPTITPQTVTQGQIKAMQQLELVAGQTSADLEPVPSDTAERTIRLAQLVHGQTQV